MLTSDFVSGALGLPSQMTKDLMDAGLVKLDTRNAFMTLQGGKSPWVSDEDLRAFHDSQTTSTVDPSKSVLARKMQLAKHFDQRFDQLMVDARRGSLNEDNFRRIKEIASDPDFDFFAPFLRSGFDFDKHGTMSPFKKIIFFAPFDSELHKNQEIELHVLDQASLNRASDSQQEFCELGTLEAFDNFNLVFEDMDIPASKAESFIKLTTEIATELLAIAQKKGMPFESHYLPEIIFQDFSGNVTLVDWLIDETNLIDDIGGQRPVDLTKMGARLDALPSVNFDAIDETEKEVLDRFYTEIEQQFYKAFSEQEKYRGYDAVRLLVHYHNKIPEALVMMLINFADSHGYDFKASYFQSHLQQDDFQNLDKPNLLSLAISPQEDLEAMPSPELVRFLLEKGISPFEERTVNITDREPEFDLWEVLDSFADAVDSGNTDDVIGFFDGKQPDLDMSPFEANMYYLADLDCLNEEERASKQHLIDRRMELAKLMKDYRD